LFVDTESKPCGYFWLDIRKTILRMQSGCAPLLHLHAVYNSPYTASGRYLRVQVRYYQKNARPPIGCKCRKCDALSGEKFCISSPPSVWIWTQGQQHGRGPVTCSSAGGGCRFLYPVGGFLFCPFAMCMVSLTPKHAAFCSSVSLRTSSRLRTPGRAPESRVPCRLSEDASRALVASASLGELAVHRLCFISGGLADESSPLRLRWRDAFVLRPRQWFLLNASGTLEARELPKSRALELLCEAFPRVRGCYPLPVWAFKQDKTWVVLPETHKATREGKPALSQLKRLSLLDRDS
jgi:hypothetical protein